MFIYKANIILFGSNGMLGKYVYSVLKNHYNVYRFTRDNYDILNDDLDLLETKITDLLSNDDIIINCSGVIPQKVGLDNYKTYIKINTLFPHILENISKKYNYKFIHITTDCVFSGKTGNYTEKDLHDASDIYGISKSLGEPKKSTVIRTSIIGEDSANNKSLLEWVRSNKGNQINGYKNHYWNGITCLTCANIIYKIINENLYWGGVKHIYSPDIVSKYDLCNYINDIYDLNIDVLEKVVDEKKMYLSGGNESEIIFEIESIKSQIKLQKEYKL